MSIFNLNNENPDYFPWFNLKKHDPTLNGDKAPFNKTTFNMDSDRLKTIFFNNCKIGYLCDYFKLTNDFRVVSHPVVTYTCYQKAGILENWDPLNVIKVLYFDIRNNDCLYACVVPETGCLVDKKHIAQVLDLPGGDFLAKAKHLPQHMTYGTCSPFITTNDLVENGGRVKRIIFDTETLIMKKKENHLDDFSFGTDHQLSIQMNYYRCYKMLKRFFGDTIEDRKILKLSFKEKLVRRNGHIKIEYEFESLNYRTAKFVNDIHGFEDVRIVNDHVDKLYLPEVLVGAYDV